NITGAEAAKDRLTVNALAGADVVEASGLAAGLVQLTARGGGGADVLDGGDGDDIEIQGFGGDTVTSATAASKDWLAASARIVRGKTVLKSGGKEHTLPRA